MWERLSAHGQRLLRENAVGWPQKTGFDGDPAGRRWHPGTVARFDPGGRGGIGTEGRKAQGNGFLPGTGKTFLAKESLPG